MVFAKRTRRFRSISMSDSPSSPLKRRRTTGTFAMSTPVVTRATRRSPPFRKLKWPAESLPIELFNAIALFLPRSSIQNMRLVCKDFEVKISEYLFRVVVVPFKPEIYGITPEPRLNVPDGLDDGLLPGSIMLQDKGMRVFEGFGARIKKFAMSFEFDEKRLANPPIKSDQEAITSFWGVYRWPYKKYNRYAQLEGLEQTADETRTMAKALRFIKNAHELGLSIDGGLGFLTGPDFNDRVVCREEKIAVFGESRFVPEPSPMGTVATLAKSAAQKPQVSGLYIEFQRILEEAGYRDGRFEELILLLARTEDLSDPQHIQYMINLFSDGVDNGFELLGYRLPLISDIGDDFSSIDGDDGSEATWPLGTERDADLIDQNILIPEATNFEVDLADVNWQPLNGFQNVADFLSTFDSGDEDEEESQYTEDEEDELDVTEIQVRPQRTQDTLKTDGYSLKPNDLSNAQREMLLEIEWAQRAFMQSYSIAIIDNPSTFHHIKALTIARLPNRHLPILRREDFWDSLPQLQKLSLGIIADWREVSKLPTSWVQDIRLQPSQSIPGVYQFLVEQVSHRKSIKELHFEWLCGGEYAPGMFSRNQHIMAAPIVLKSINMIDRTLEFPILNLPHVEHLSLKNCWVSPHIMKRFTTSLRESSLQTLTLDSVSLTAAVPKNLQPNPMAHAPVALNLGLQPLAPQDLNALFPHFQGVANQPILNGINPFPPAPVVSVEPNVQWREPPREGSWADVIEGLLPSRMTLAKLRHDRGEGPEPDARKTTNLTKLSFRSCGYVRIPLDFDQTAIDNPQPPIIPAYISKQMSGLEFYMMRPNDNTLGAIINYISTAESDTLCSAWNLHVGWIERQVLFRDCQSDGVALPGSGRFEGDIDTSPDPTLSA